MKIILRPETEFKTKKEYREYLTEMARLPTPDAPKGWDIYSYQDFCYEFSQLRNNAKKELSKLEESLKAEPQIDENKGGSDQNGK